MLLEEDYINRFYPELNKDLLTVLHSARYDEEVLPVIIEQSDGSCGLQEVPRPWVSLMPQSACSLIAPRVPCCSVHMHACEWHCTVSVSKCVRACISVVCI